jgi:hypothetical protein
MSCLLGRWVIAQCSLCSRGRALDFSAAAGVVGAPVVDSVVVAAASDHLPSRASLPPLVLLAPQLLIRLLLLLPIICRLRFSSCLLLILWLLRGLVRVYTRDLVVRVGGHFSLRFIHLYAGSFICKVLLPLPLLAVALLCQLCVFLSVCCLSCSSADCWLYPLFFACASSDC